MSISANQNDSLLVCGKPALELELQLAARVRGRLAAGEFTEQDMRIVADLNKRNDDLRLTLSDIKLERIRRLCQLWDIELRSPNQITSHRKFVGPFIVAAKKLVYPILRVLLKDLIRQQRDFNGSVISYLAESEAERKGRD